MIVMGRKSKKQRESGNDVGEAIVEEEGGDEVAAWPGDIEVKDMDEVMGDEMVKELSRVQVRRKPTT